MFLLTRNGQPISNNYYYFKFCNLYGNIQCSISTKMERDNSVTDIVNEKSFTVYWFYHNVRKTFTLDKFTELVGKILWFVESP